MRNSSAASQRPRAYRTLVFGLVVVLAGLGLQAVISGCAANDPFDPASLANHRPTVEMFVAAPDTGSFPATSYFERNFYWHGSDQDGWITGFDVSIRLERGVPAPWVNTTRTDTFMTFVTDDNGEAEATFLLVAHDNRGALSDTLREFFPLRNFPPEIHFDPDFDPLSNLQREIVGGAQPDTLYWNWGYGNFKLTASDRDGVSTMDQFFRYTFADVEPTETYQVGDPLADPNTTWVQAPFLNAGDPTTGFREFEIPVDGVPVGLRTMTVSIKDEGGSDSRFTYSWDVRAPRSNILYIQDNSSSIGRQCYTEFMDGRFGAGNWDTYDFWMGYPDRHTTLTSVMREYDAVLWTDGGVTSDILVKASERGGALEAYVFGSDTEPGGKLMIVSSVLVGSRSRLGANFRLRALGVDSRGEPVTDLTLPVGKQALGLIAGLPAMTSDNSINGSTAKGIGLKALATAEPLYRMEDCPGCYTRRPPSDPVIAVRSPLRTDAPLAQTISVSIQLEFFDRAEVLAALNSLFDNELGVASR